MISVIIATKNRANALRDISLPSLLKQTLSNFEILIWDASDSTETEKVIQIFVPLFKNKGVFLRYYQAPRVGSCSQRNDAIKKVCGDVAFFMDDDMEISTKAIHDLQDLFSSFTWLMGATFPMLDLRYILPVKRNKIIRFFSRALAFFLFRAQKNSPFVFQNERLSIKNMPGGCMACRVSIFNDLYFDERLEHFSTYAFSEDLDFSHRVFLHFKKPLLVLNQGFAIHHGATGKRTSNCSTWSAMKFFNTRIMKENFEHYDGYAYSNWAFYREQRVGMVINLLRDGCSIKDIIAGYFLYKKAYHAMRDSGVMATWEA